MAIDENDGRVRTLAEWRELALLTQAELAEQIGVNVATVRAWEQGRNKPRGRHHRRVAEFLGVRPTQIVFPSKAPRRSAHKESRTARTKA